MGTLRFDHEGPPDMRQERSDLRAHYESVAAGALAAIRRDWRLIASLVALALTLACAVIPLMPRKYSATALVYPNLFSDDRGKVAPLGSVDAASLVTSEARLIVSDGILQAVVKRLGLGLDPEEKSQSWAAANLDWLRTTFLPETRNHSQFDRQVALLRNNVEVMKDTRSYLIPISFTARSADEAAQIVNAIALEYLRGKAIQRRQDAVAAAEGELSRQLAIFGDKHPKVLQVVEALDSARAALKAAMNPEDGAHDIVAADDTVMLAIPNRTPTSPKGLVIIGLSLMLSLSAGVGLAVWRDRSGLLPQFQRPPVVRSSHGRRGGEGEGRHPEAGPSGESDRPARNDGNEADVVVRRAGAAGASSTTTLLGVRRPLPKR